MRRMLRNPRIVIPVVGVVLAGLAWLAFGWFAVHKLVVDERVDEAAPVFDRPAGAAGAAGVAGVVVERAGSFEDGEHDTTGTAVVLGDGSGQRFLRFESFETSNGPDLNVYLAEDVDDVDGAVDLGDLKGNIGNQNYSVPDALDLERYDTVVVWCVRFSVAFGHATLESA